VCVVYLHKYGFFTPKFLQQQQQQQGQQQQQQVQLQQSWRFILIRVPLAKSIKSSASRSSGVLGRSTSLRNVSSSIH